MTRIEAYNVLHENQLFSFHFKNMEWKKQHMFIYKPCVLFIYIPCVLFHQFSTVKENKVLITGFHVGMASIFT